MPNTAPPEAHPNLFRRHLSEPKKYSWPGIPTLIYRRKLSPREVNICLRSHSQGKRCPWSLASFHYSPLLSWANWAFWERLTGHPWPSKQGPRSWIRDPVERLRVKRNK